MCPAVLNAGFHPLQVNLIFLPKWLFILSWIFLCKKGLHLKKVLKDLETIVEITGLIHKTLVTYNFHKMN